MLSVSKFSIDSSVSKQTFNFYGDLYCTLPNYTSKYLYFMIQVPYQCNVLLILILNNMKVRIIRRDQKIVLPIFRIEEIMDH